MACSRQSKPKRPVVIGIVDVKLIIIRVDTAGVIGELSYVKSQWICCIPQNRPVKTTSAEGSTAVGAIPRPGRLADEPVRGLVCRDGDRVPDQYPVVKKIL